jgi:hypothetical protein
MVFNWIRDFLVGYEVSDEDESLFDRIVDLESRVLNLEIENVELTNALYESETRLQMKIDNINPVVYNLNSKNCDQ